MYNQIALLVVLGIAVTTDVRFGKIKNWLTLPAIALGPIIHFMQGGGTAAISSLEAIGIMILVCAVLASLRLFGGGDIKLLMAAGSLAGVSMVLNILLYTAISGGLLALIFLIRKRKASAVTKQVSQEVMTSLVLKIRPNITVGSGIKIPYSIAIAAGCLLAMA